MRVVNGWRLFEHAAFKLQKAKLEAAVEVRKKGDPDNWQNSADAKLLKAIQHLTHVVIPASPGAKQFRQGDTLGEGRKHWYRAKFGNGRYRLFFQFSSTEKAIIYAWVNDEDSLRTYGSKTDAYAMFESMVAKGSPPDSWQELAKAVGAAVKRDEGGRVKPKKARSRGKRPGKPR